MAMEESVSISGEATTELPPIEVVESPSRERLQSHDSSLNDVDKGSSKRNGKISRAASTNEFGTSSKSAKPVRKKSMLPPGLTLEEINRQIAEVREQRKELMPTEGRVQGARVDYSVRPKKSFHHPKLDYVIAEAVHSPYLTKPQDSYPKETFTMNATLRDLKREGKVLAEVPPEEKPINPKHAKNKFIREVANFNPTFSMANAMASDGKTPIRASTGQLEKLLAVFNQGTRSTAGQGEYKSATLQAAEARGGPVKFKKQLSGLIARRTPSSSAMCGDDTLGFAAEGSVSSFFTQVPNSPDPDAKNRSNEQPTELPGGIPIHRGDASGDVNDIYGIEEFENEDTTTTSEEKAAILAQQKALIEEYYNKTNMTYVIAEDAEEDKITPTAAAAAAREQKKREDVEAAAASGEGGSGGGSTTGSKKTTPTNKTTSAKAGTPTRSQKLKPSADSTEEYQEEVFEEEAVEQQPQQQQQSSKSAHLLVPINSTAVSANAVDCVSPVPVHQLGSAHNSSSALNSLTTATAATAAAGGGGGGGSSSSKVNHPEVVTSPPVEEVYEFTEFNEAPVSSSSGPATAGSYVVDGFSPVDNTASGGGVNYDDMVLGGESVDEIPDDIIPEMNNTNGSILEESYSHIEQIEYKDDFVNVEESDGGGGESPIKNQVDNYVEEAPAAAAPSQ